MLCYGTVTRRARYIAIRRVTCWQRSTPQGCNVGALATQRNPSVLSGKRLFVSCQSRPSSLTVTAQNLNQALRSRFVLLERNLSLHCLHATSDALWLMHWGARQPPILPLPDKVAAVTPTVLAHSSAMTCDDTLWSVPWHVISEQMRRCVQTVHSFLQSVWDFWRLSLRGAQVLARLSPLLILTPLAVANDLWLTTITTITSTEYDSQVRQRQQKHVQRNRVADASWWYFTSSMQALGPVFVKFCQWVATRPDIFPPHVCNRLAVLHDRALPHAWKHTDKMLRQAFGEDYEAAGLHIDSQQVIGCGSAAQVYRGRLVMRQTDAAAAKDSNHNETITTSRPVAIKVLHPNFSQLVERDFWLMQHVAAWLHALPVESIRMLNLPRVANNFGTLLQAQSDLRIEANHLRTFRRNFYADSSYDDEEQEGEQGHVQLSYSSISFPRPVKGWESENVLVEELVNDARPISDFLKDDSDEGIAIRKELAGPLLRAFLKMIFVDNFTHGDLHPGNVFIRTKQIPVKQVASGNFWSNPFGSKPVNADGDEGQTITKRTIVFLDAGIATTLSKTDQRNLLDLFRAIILNQGEQAGRLMVERAKFERCTEIPGGVEAFSKGIGELVAEFHDNRKQGLTLGAVRIGSLLSRVLDLCRVYGVEIDPSMASIVVSTLVLEGLGRSLEPSLNLIDFAVPFVLGRGRV